MPRAFVSLVIGPIFDDRQVSRLAEMTEDPGGEQKPVRAAREPLRTPLSGVTVTLQSTGESKWYRGRLGGWCRAACAHWVNCREFLPRPA